jgi:predicted nucleic acid-binding Zn ribbon protein
MAAMDLNYFGAPDAEEIIAAEQRRERIARRLAVWLLVAALGALVAAVWLAGSVLSL